MLAEAPFTVLAPGSEVVNHPPGAIEAAFEPAIPLAGDVIFCRITSPTLFLDPDYDFVRYHYHWTVNGTVVRDIISAGLADAIAADKLHTSDELTCVVTPTDGVGAHGPITTLTAVLGGGRPLNISTRLTVGTDDNVLIGGFIVTGTDPKNVIIRAI